MATGKGSAFPTVKTTLLRQTILKRRREGVAFERIAAELGYSLTYTHKQYRKALKEIIVDDVNDLRKLEMQKLDALEEEVYKVLKAFVPLISNGVVVLEAAIGPDGKILLNDEGKPIYTKVRDLGIKLKAVDRLIRVMERRARLLGLDKPVKVSSTDPDGNEVRPITSTMTLEEAAAAYAETREQEI